MYFNLFRHKITTILKCLSFYLLLVLVTACSVKESAPQHYSDAYDTSAVSTDHVTGKRVITFSMKKIKKNAKLFRSSYYMDELVVGLNPPYTGHDLQRLLTKLSNKNNIFLNVIDSISGRSIYLIEFADKKGLLSTLKPLLADDPIIAYHEPNFINTNQGNQFLVHSLPEQWSLQNQGIEDYPGGGKYDADSDGLEALSRFTYGRERKSPVLVAIVDSGTDVTHPALSPALWTNPGEITNNQVDDDRNGFIDDIHGWNFASSNSSLVDNSGHGTHVAGIVGAKPIVNSNTYRPLTGIAPHVKLLTAKTSESDLHATFHIVKAVYYAVDMKADIINLSLGSYSFSQAMFDAIRAAIAKNTLVVAAAGNDAKDVGLTPFFPCAILGVFCVASTDKYDSLSSFSNYQASNYQTRPTISLAAPGEEIISTAPGGKYIYMSGTSMAAPLVAGSLALLRGLYPNDDIVASNRKLQDGAEILRSLDLKVLGSRRLNIFRSMFQPSESFDDQGKPYRHQVVEGEGSRGLRYPYANSRDPGVDGMSLATAFKIASMKQFLNIRDEDLNKHFVLTNNIDWTELLPHERQPLNKIFTGLFDGQGFSIQNYTVKGSAAPGLFREIGVNGRVINLKMTGVSISGVSRVAPIAAQITHGVINNVQVEGNLTGSFQGTGGLVGHASASIITNCYFEGTITSPSPVVGGLAGSVGDNTQISRCHVAAKITSAGGYAGGITGLLENSVIRDSYANCIISGPSYLGGIASDAYYSTIENCYTEGKVNASASSSGGVAAFMKAGQMINCYSLSFVSRTSKSGGLLGDGSDFVVRNSYFADRGNSVGVGGTPKSLIQLRDKNTFIGWWGIASNPWTIPTGFSPASPHLPRSVTSLY